MILFYSDLSNQNAEILAKEQVRRTPIEMITSFFSLGSYYQAYPLCHNVLVSSKSMIMECRGDMIIQEVFNIDVFEHSSQLCSNDPSKFKNSMNQTEQNEFKELVDKSVKCDKDTFFDKTTFTKSFK